MRCAWGKYNKSAPLRMCSLKQKLAISQFLLKLTDCRFIVAPRVEGRHAGKFGGCRGSTAMIE
jgi:hypothetical protein